MREAQRSCAGRSSGSPWVAIAFGHRETPGGVGATGATLDFDPTVSIGKTALVDAARWAAGERGMTVIDARGTEFEAEPRPAGHVKSFEKLRDLHLHGAPYIPLHAPAPPTCVKARVSRE